MSNINSLKSLLKEDQDNIKYYKQGKISLAEFSKEASLITGRFAEWLKINDVPDHKLENEEYTAFVVLLLHSGGGLMSKILDSSIEKIKPKDRAYLTDKIRVLKNEPQIYGTQYKGVKDGKVEFLPIENLEEVDKKREEMGLGLLEEYRKKILGL